jgi:hypothetical protein
VWVRRLNDLIVLFEEDLGGDLTEMQRALIRRAATLVTELERAEAVFANAGAADPGALSAYQTTANSLRRLLETLGLPKRMPPVKQIEAVVNAPPRSGYVLGNVDGAGTEYFSDVDSRDADLERARALAFTITDSIRTGALVPEVIARLAEELKLARIVRFVDGEAHLEGIGADAPATV